MATSESQSRSPPQVGTAKKLVRWTRAVKRSPWKSLTNVRREREREGEEESSDFYGEFLLFVPVHEADSGRPGPYRAGCKWVERLGTSTGPGLVARFSPRQYHKNFDKIVLRIYLVSTKLKRGYAIFILKKCNLSPHELPSDEYRS